MITKEYAIKVRISEEMNITLREYAEQANKSLSEVVREAIDLYLKTKETK